ncbi:MAG: bifunctional 5,10-methylenetetrahydrofolate dehydrogenase/5,10-methenyltetrahydrofolate cyclohydrolase [Oligoflexales bacterium]|nr:bifunctional 5,10-methylenetetrahydrofolate dehydrogenase/5,10-methenyltetrahydrofolate cyclohydrolase [Oligoflexales bacterium]
MQWIDGKKLAETRNHNLKNLVQVYLSQKRRRPCLAVILVGNNPASESYVKNKEKACATVGIESKAFKLKETTTHSELVNLIEILNADALVDGILLQLPLPDHLKSFEIIEKILPAKDVDGLTAKNQGLLCVQQDAFIPCTPLGVLHLLESISFDLSGKIAAVVGRSQLVGSPLVRLLTKKDATVIQIHSKSVKPWQWCSQADVLVVAAGVPHLVDEKWIKEGAVVIDVGIHRLPDGTLCGDVQQTEEVHKKVLWITPVPGGVGPMTINSLLTNCMKAYERNVIS